MGWWVCDLAFEIDTVNKIGHIVYEISRRWRCLRGPLCTAIFLFAICGNALAQGSGSTKFREYEVKAAFLLNFMQFVEWPASVTNSTKTPFLIGILGEDPFGTTLEEIIKDENINGRTLTIKRKRQATELKDCQLIFVCRSEKTQLKEILSTLRGSCSLTVSDTDQFCRHGGMIGLFNEGGKIRFEINQEAAEQSQLKISSKLLRLGRLTAK